MWTSPPISAAAVSALAVVAVQVAVVVLGQKQNGHAIYSQGVRTLEDAGFGLELFDQLGHRLDLDAGLAAGRLLGLQDLEARRGGSTPKSAGDFLSSGFFLAFMMFGSEA